MTTATIEKCIELLNANSLDDLRNLLNYERQASILKGNGQKTTLLTAVKKALGKRPDRPVLETIQHTADGKPFICDGYFLVKWNTDKPELDGLPQTPADKSVNGDGIIPQICNLTEYELTDDDKTILKNIDKYIKLYPAAKGDYSVVKLFSGYFDAKLIKKVVSIIGTDFDSIWLKESYDRLLYSGTIFEGDYTAVIMSMRVDTTEQAAANDARTAAFLEVIKEAR